MSLNRRLYSLVFVRDFDNNKILLGLKKRGFGKGKWNGFGGKLEKDENIIECAKRFNNFHIS
jgi:8-oxo-dGTP diphosphatase / 2-hydroxy-dATP diphosphatase